MSVLLTIFIFIVIFSLIVIIHELGHFFMARRVGIKVEEFGLGLPPQAKKLWRDKMGTIFSLNWIPFGGFVRMYGEDSTNPKLVHDKKSFMSKTKWQRTQVICAGVFMNFITGVILLTIVFTAGAEPFILNRGDFERHLELGNIVTEDGILINEVTGGSAAEKAGFQSGDIILKINGEGVGSSEEIVALTQNFKNRILNYTLERDREEIAMQVHIPNEGKIGVSIASIPIIREVKKVQFPVHIAFIESIKESGRLASATAVMFADVLRRLVSQFQISDNVAGPIGIAQMTHSVSQQGLIALLKFMALLSVSLATINILPLPALDGGRFLFIIVEFIRRKRANARWESAIHGIGFILLMFLIAMITYKDILRLIFG
jgi:regulator of sigma E protease